MLSVALNLMKGLVYPQIDTTLVKFPDFNHPNFGIMKIEREIKSIRSRFIQNVLYQKKEFASILIIK